MIEIYVCIGYYMPAVKTFINLINMMNSELLNWEDGAYGMSGQASSILKLPAWVALLIINGRYERCEVVLWV